MFFSLTIIFLIFFLVFVFFFVLQTYYDICFFHILSLYFLLLQIILYTYFLLSLLIVVSSFYNNLLLYLMSHLYFFHNKLFHSSFIYNDKNYIDPVFSFRLGIFIIFIASFVLTCQK